MRKNTFVAHPLGTKLEAKMHPKAVLEQKKKDFFGVRISNGVFNDFRCPPDPPGTVLFKNEVQPLTQESLRRGVRDSLLERFWLHFRRHLGTEVEKNKPEKTAEKTLPKKSPE